MLCISYFFFRETSSKEWENNTICNIIAINNYIPATYNTINDVIVTIVILVHDKKHRFTDRILATLARFKFYLRYVPLAIISFWLEAQWETNTLFSWISIRQQVPGEPSLLRVHSNHTKESKTLLKRTCKRKAIYFSSASVIWPIRCKTLSNPSINLLAVLFKKYLYTVRSLRIDNSNPNGKQTYKLEYLWKNFIGRVRT